VTEQSIEDHPSPYLSGLSSPGVACVAAALATGVAFVALGLGHGFNVPLVVDVDAAGSLALAKGFTEGGGPYSNPWLGAPGRHEGYDFPNCDALNTALLAGIAYVVREPVVAVNVFLLASFAFAAASAAFVALRLQVWAPAAVLTGTCFALLPYHFYRGVGHLYLANYFMVPVSILMALRLMAPLPPSLLSGNHSKHSRRVMTLATCACIAIGTTGIYYAIFSCLLYCVAGMYGWPRHGRRNAVAMVALIAITGITALAQGVPRTVYRLREGHNQAAVERSRGGGELYGFRLGQIVLPAEHHRLPALRAIGQAYSQGLQGLGLPKTEAQNSASLGILGSVGFLLLLPLIAMTRSRPTSGESCFENFLHKLSVLGVAVFTLGVCGGVGSLMGLAFPLIRAYNRISVVAGFLGLLLIAGLLTWLARQARRPGQKALCFTLCAVLTILASADQVPVGLYDRGQTDAQWHAMADFVSQVETAVPPGSMVFQLPYVPFPEHPPIHRMVDYDHLKPYLHSHGIRWSYGAIKGRAVSEWQERTASLPVQKLVSELKKKGFCAIWVDRFGYHDSGAALEHTLSTVLGSPPLLTSDDGRYSVWRLGNDLLGKVLLPSSSQAFLPVGQ